MKARARRRGADWAFQSAKSVPARSVLCAAERTTCQFGVRWDRPSLESARSGGCARRNTPRPLSPPWGPGRTRCRGGRPRGVGWAWRSTGIDRWWAGWYRQAHGWRKHGEGNPEKASKCCSRQRHRGVTVPTLRWHGFLGHAADARMRARRRSRRRRRCTDRTSAPRGGVGSGRASGRGVEGGLHRRERRAFRDNRHRAAPCDETREVETRHINGGIALNTSREAPEYAAWFVLNSAAGDLCEGTPDGKEPVLGDFPGT